MSCSSPWTCAKLRSSAGVTLETRTTAQPASVFDGPATVPGVAANTSRARSGDGMPAAVASSSETGMASFAVACSWLQAMPPRHSPASCTASAWLGAISTCTERFSGTW